MTAEDPALRPPPSALPFAARRSLRIYNFAFPFVLLALLPGFLLRMFRRGRFREKFGQRLALFSPTDRQRLAGRRWIWIHSISVGETLIALKLAREFHARDPAAGILISTTTVTGFAVAREAGADWLEVIYNPLDFVPVVRRALNLLRPQQLLFIEGEAWPNLLAQCRARDIPTALIDARLSPRSEARFRRFRRWTAPIFNLLDLICLPAREDMSRWVDLGLPAEKLCWTGSIKFDHSAPPPSRAEEFWQLVAPLGFTRETPILVAGSTHEGEEEILAHLLIALRRDVPDTRMILVPRHVERTATILRALAPLRLRIALRSEIGITQHSEVAAHGTSGGRLLGESGGRLLGERTLNTQLLLVDSTGELRDWYELATIVFIGKTLTTIGGQNPAEPALLGKPIVFGPHTENFAALTAHLLARDAAVQVCGADALQEEMKRLLSDPARRERLGANARSSLHDHQGATARVADRLTS